MIPGATFARGSVAVCVRENCTWARGSGNIERYTFHADGRVDYQILIAVQNYGCRLEAFSSSKGRAGFDGRKLEIHLNPGSVRRDDSCSASKNYTHSTKTTSYSYDWGIGDDGYGNTQLVLTQSDGSVYYYRKLK